MAAHVGRQCIDTVARHITHSHNSVCKDSDRLLDLTTLIAHTSVDRERDSCLRARRVSRKDRTRTRRNLTHGSSMQGRRPAPSERQGRRQSRREADLRQTRSRLVDADSPQCSIMNIGGREVRRLRGLRVLDFGAHWGCAACCLIQSQRGTRVQYSVYLSAKSPTKNFSSFGITTLWM